jgi:hypothetical protein
MKYLMLVCWDAERMDAQTEPDLHGHRQLDGAGVATRRLGLAGSAPLDVG